MKESVWANWEVDGNYLYSSCAEESNRTGTPHLGQYRVKFTYDECR